MVTINKQIQRRWDSEDRLLNKMYDAFPVGEKQEWLSIKKAVDMFKEPEGSIASALITFEDLGILHRDLAWPDFQKQKVDWTLTVPKHEAERLIEAWHERVRMSPVYLRYPTHTPRSRSSKKEEPNEEPQIEGMAIATKPASEGQELVAVAGPEAESPFAALRVLRKDESRAIVGAARQYADKGSFLDKKIEELRAEGFEVSPGALSIKRDERLEHVALALPYISSLEQTNERLLGQNNGARETTRAYEDLRIRFERLKRENERLVADRVNASSAAMAR